MSPEELARPGGQEGVGSPRGPPSPRGRGRGPGRGVRPPAAVSRSSHHDLRRARADRGRLAGSAPVFDGAAAESCAAPPGGAVVGSPRSAPHGATEAPYDVRAEKHNRRRTATRRPASRTLRGGTDPRVAVQLHPPEPWRPAYQSVCTQTGDQYIWPMVRFPFRQRHFGPALSGRGGRRRRDALARPKPASRASAEGATLG